MLSNVMKQCRGDRRVKRRESKNYSPPTLPNVLPITLGASSQEGEEKLVEAGEGWDRVQLSDCRNGRCLILVFASFSFYNHLVNH